MTKKKTSQSAKVITLKFDDNALARDLFGAEDRHLRSLQNRLGIDVDVRGTDVHLQGVPKDVETGEKVLNELYRLLKKGYPIMGSDIERAMKLVARDREADLESLFSSSIFLPAKKRVIMPRSPGQKAYIEAMRTHDVVFTIGPAGTGKSYLAVAVAMASLLKKEYERVILARPAVEAGEKLGYLPGDMQEKVNPYLRPLRDALYDMLDAERVEELMMDDIIEIAPIAFMRGRTLHRAFIILDEGQNCSYQQMKMCLTRLGMDSKMVVTGDVTQIDLQPGQRSGLLEAWRILRGTEDIAFHEFTEADIVRHPIVTDIVEAYRRDEGSNG
jgi:phosphate starvation-inducible PhoH-like protein